ncbi:MAG: glutamate racemase [Patescibacteria group bacterium]|nr:glutamate racemase [Patescibacteria group bacterium]
MKIGIFDSGLGGLVIAKAIFKKLPRYDYVYLGDTQYLPYGNRSAAEVYRLTRAAVEFLFAQDCQLIIIACNTASALALRKIQREYLPKHYPGRRVLGVVIPTLEAVTSDKANSGELLVLATAATVKSHIYRKELQKLKPQVRIIERAAPKLVPLIENNQLSKAEQPLRMYLDLLPEHKIYAIILGCTHYPLLKDKISQIAGKHVKIVSQTDIIPFKLADYLSRHKGIRLKLSRGRQRQFFVTKSSHHFSAVAKRLFGEKIKFNVVKY